MPHLVVPRPHLETTKNLDGRKRRPLSEPLLMRSAYAPWPTARSPHPYAPRRGGWQPVDEVSYHRAHHGHAYGAYPTGRSEAIAKGVSWVSIDSPNERERRAASQCAPPARPRMKRVDSHGPSYAAAPQGARSLSAVPVSATGPMSTRETQAVQHLLDENDSLYRELEGLHLTVTELRRQAAISGGGAESLESHRPPPVATRRSSASESDWSPSEGTQRLEDERATHAQVRAEVARERDSLRELTSAVQREQATLERLQQQRAAAESGAGHSSDAEADLRARLEEAEEAAERWQAKANRLQAVVNEQQQQQQQRRQQQQQQQQQQMRSQKPPQRLAPPTPTPPSRSERRKERNQDAHAVDYATEQYGDHRMPTDASFADGGGSTPVAQAVAGAAVGAAVSAAMVAGLGAPPPIVSRDSSYFGGSVRDVDGSGGAPSERYEREEGEGGYAVEEAGDARPDYVEEEEESEEEGEEEEEEEGEEEESEGEERSEGEEEESEEEEEEEESESEESEEEERR